MTEFNFRTDASVIGEQRELSELTYRLAMIRGITVEGDDEGDAEKTITALSDVIVNHTKLDNSGGVWLVFRDVGSWSDFKYGIVGAFTDERAAWNYVTQILEDDPIVKRDEFSFHCLGQLNPEKKRIDD